MNTDVARGSDYVLRCLCGPASHVQRFQTEIDLFAIPLSAGVSLMEGGRSLKASLSASILWPAQTKVIGLVVGGEPGQTCKGKEVKGGARGA